MKQIFNLFMKILYWMQRRIVNYISPLLNYIKIEKSIFQTKKSTLNGLQDPKIFKTYSYSDKNKKILFRFWHWILYLYPYNFNIRNWIPRLAVIVESTKYSSMKIIYIVSIFFFMMNDETDYRLVNKKSCVINYL